MKKNLWFSAKASQEQADKSIKRQWNSEEARNIFTQDAGYLIAIDKSGCLYQYTKMSNDDGYYSPKDKDDYKLVTSLKREDFDILIFSNGQVNKKIADKFDLAPNLDAIKSIIPNFYDTATFFSFPETVKFNQNLAKAKPLKMDK